MDEGMDESLRARLRQVFLDGTDWNRAVQYPLPGDASFRRYIRLNQNGRRALLMDAPPPHEDVRPFVQVARHLCSLGFSAPEIWAEDAVNGFLLLEDFGDDTFTHLLAKGANETALYTLATDVLIALHRQDSACRVPSNVPPYDDQSLRAETALLPDWFLSAHALTLTSAARTAYDQAWLDLFPHVQAGPRALVLRDYHVDNLMRLDGRDGIKACGLLDFQDARTGHPAYDLMSLLEDARRDVPETLQTALKARYHTALGTTSPEAFQTAYAILAAQRHAKVIGIFTRLDKRDGKPVYLKHIARVWRLLEKNLEHPALGALKSWFDRHIPAEKRCATRAKP